jgi:hypothetical protein
VSLKSLTIGVAAAAAVGAAAAGVTSVASVPTVSSPAITPAVFGAPLPLDVTTPTVDQLTQVLTGLADPTVPFHNKGNLVEGGVGIIEGKTADRLLANASQKGDLPLAFQVSNVVPVASDPGAVTATVVASGPQLAPTTQTVTFVNRDGTGWKLSRGSATSLLQAAMASA